MGDETVSRLPDYGKLTDAPEGGGTDWLEDKLAQVASAIDLDSRPSAYIPSVGQHPANLLTQPRGFYVYQLPLSLSCNEDLRSRRYHCRADRRDQQRYPLREVSTHTEGCWFSPLFSE